MKIQNLGISDSNLRVGGGQGGVRGGGRPSSSVRGAGSGEKVAISSQARLVGMAQRAVSEAPDIRMERVQPIEARVADGSYHVDSGTVADRILMSALRGGR